MARVASHGSRKRLAVMTKPRSPVSRSITSVSRLSAALRDE